MNQTYRKHVSEPWHGHIKSGRKSIEGRCRKGDFNTMKKGDTVIWVSDNGSECLSKISKVVFYDTFAEYLWNEGISKCLPGVDTLSEGLNVYTKSAANPLGYFTKEQEQEYGVVAVHFELI
jgi:ASC-1-like (ASCH) protein